MSALLCIHLPHTLLHCAGAAAAGGAVGVAGLSSGNTGSQRSGYGTNTVSGSNTGYSSNTGSGSNTGYGSGNTGNTESSTAAKAKSYIPGTAENKASHSSGNGGNTGYDGSGYSSTGTASGYSSGTGTGSGFGSGATGGGMTGQPGAARGGLSTGETTSFGHEQAPQSGAAVYNADGVSVSSLAGGTTGAQHAIGSGSGSSSNTGAGIKSHIPGTQEHRETSGTGTGTGSGSGTGYSSNTSNTGYGSNAGNIGRDADYNRTTGNTGTNTGFSGGMGNTGYGSSNTSNTDRDGKPSAAEKLKKLIPGTPEYKAAHGNNTDRDTTTGLFTAFLALSLSAASIVVMLLSLCVKWCDDSQLLHQTMLSAKQLSHVCICSTAITCMQCKTAVTCLHQMLSGSYSAC